MPIRTHRGRAAVYRTLWGWPLRSPRHLAALVLVLAVIGVGVAVALPDRGPGRAVAPPSDSSRANPFDPQSRTPPTTVDERPDRGATRPQQAPAAAVTVAEQWVLAFLRAPEGITSEQWVEQLRPYTTEEALAELRTVDPANVPAATISGPPRSISAGAGSAEIDVPTTAAVVRLLVVPTAAGWRVSGFDQVG